MTTLFKKGLVFAVIVLFIGAGVVPSIIGDNGTNSTVKTEYATANIMPGKLDGTASKNDTYNGSLSGYVTDTSMNPIEGARIRVSFHDTYEENYTDASGYYNVTNIPICWCWKNATASKNGYTTEWVLLAIVENTTHDFILAPLSDVYVDDDADPVWYDATHVKTIQEGIDNATAGDTVYVFNGTYYENVVIDKTINLIGEDRNDTIIDGGGSGDVVQVATNNVNISKISMSNSGSSWFQDAGLDISYASNCNVSDCSFYDNGYAGIRLDNCNDSVFYHCLAYNNGANIYFTSSSGNLFQYCISNNSTNGLRGDYNSNNNYIENCEFYNNDGSGVVFYHGPKYNVIKQCRSSNNSNGVTFYESGTSNNTCYNCTLYDNRIGAKCQLSANSNIIHGNIIKNNSEYGIRIFMSSYNNTIYHNSFINNNQNANDVHSSLWYNLTLHQGNYWDDYTGPDADGDGIGDIPYNISGGSNQDLYPFIEENGWLKSIDVDQDVWDRGFPIRHAIDGDWAGAQSFKTSNDSLTRVDVYLRRFGTPEFNLTLEVRENSPDGTLIESFEFEPDEVDVNWGWFNLDLIDINTTPGTDYFIVCPPAPSGVTTSFGYEWGYAFGNQYDDGAFWFTRDGGGLWRDLPTMYEFVFRTYGYS